MSAEDTGWPDGLMRLLDITWPKSTGVPPHPVEIALHEHGTNLPIHSATDMVITASVTDPPMTARLTMLVGEDGLPLLGGRDEGNRIVLDEHSEPHTGEFTWVVAEMRVAE